MNSGVNVAEAGMDIMIESVSLPTVQVVGQPFDE